MSSDSGSGSALGDDVFTVERILESRKLYGSTKIEYLIKWAGYPDSENTWEPEANIIDQTVILDFQRRKEEERERRRAELGPEASGHDKDKKRVVYQNLTQLASSIRKGHDVKFEKKLQKKREQLEKRKNEEKLAQARKLQQVLQKTIDDEHDYSAPRAGPSLSSREKDKIKGQKRKPSTSTSMDKDKHKSKGKVGKSYPSTSTGTATSSKPGCVSSLTGAMKAVEINAQSGGTQTSDNRVRNPNAIGVDAEAALTPKDGTNTVFQLLPKAEQTRFLADVGINDLMGPSAAPAPPKTGFEKGYKVDSIIGISCKKTAGSGGVMILVQWQSVDKGDNDVELVPMDILRVREPQMLIQFFQERTCFYSGDEQSDSNSDSSDSSDSSSSDTE